jgi:V8-like Glu-specific endopeptidase
VGPRDVLTASHVVVWNDDGSSGWLRFTPSYFDTSEPFGHADAVHWYAYRKVTPPTIDADEAREDHAVLVLDTRLGDTVGWMGNRGYDDGWDGSAFWTHVGYPGDFSGGKRPSYQASIALNGSDTQPDTNEAIDHQDDVWPGQSEGPFFAW